MSRLPEPPEEGKVQPDGRTVFGPDLSDEDGQSGFGPGLIIAVVFCLAFAAAGFLGGRVTAPQPTWQELYTERILDACLPSVQVAGVGPDRARLTQSVNTVLQQVRLIASDGKDIESHIISVPPDARLRQKNKDAELIALVTLERCL